MTLSPLKSIGLFLPLTPYKTISKIIIVVLRHIFSRNISREHFGFLEGYQIHEAIGVGKEGMHNIDNRKIIGIIAKIYLSKPCDRINWIYLRMLLTHLGFEIPFINLVMGCITNVSFSVVINRSTTHFSILREG